LPDVRLTILRRRMDVSCWLDNMDGRRLELEVLLYIESNVLVGELVVELYFTPGIEKFLNLHIYVFIDKKIFLL